MDELLSTKWHIPQGDATLAPRPELFTRLDGALESQLTLTSAPAGFGKTTLIGQRATQNQVPVAWLSLDEEDNDLVRFLTYLLAAIRAVAPEPSDANLTLRHSTQPQPGDMMMAVLINELASRTQPIFLVLDDYHVIDSRGGPERAQHLIPELEVALIPNASYLLTMQHPEIVNRRILEFLQSGGPALLLEVDREPWASPE